MNDKKRKIKAIIKPWLAGLLALGLAAASLQPVLAASSDLSGSWRLSDGKVTVRIRPCGNAFCGFVSALKEPLSKEGKPKVDHENPNPGLRNRPVIGLQVLFGLKGSGDGPWTGTIYNADDGYTYAAYIMRKGNDQLRLRACYGPFCKNRTFNRVE